MAFVCPRRKFRLTKRIETSGGRKTISTGYIPPFPYVGNTLGGWAIRKELEGFDVYQAVGGGAMPAAMFWVNSHRYVIWMGPMLMDEIEHVHWKEDLKAGFPSIAAIKITGKLSLWFEKKVLQSAARVFVQSPQAISGVQSLGVGPEKVEFLGFPVDTQKFSPGTSSYRPSFPYILCVGRVDDARKNFPLLIRVFTRVKKSMPDLKLVIIGRVSNNSPAKRMVREMGLEQDVLFTGHVEDLVDYYRGAEAFVLASRQEALGIVLLEAMACGIPVVCSRCGGPEGIIHHGSTGMLVDHDELEFSRTLLEVLKDKAFRDVVGRQARGYILEQHTMDRFCARLARAYEEVYDGPPKA